MVSRTPSGSTVRLMSRSVATPAVEVAGTLGASHPVAGAAPAAPGFVVLVRFWPVESSGGVVEVAGTLGASHPGAWAASLLDGYPRASCANRRAAVLRSAASPNRSN